MHRVNAHAIEKVCWEEKKESDR